MVRVEAFNALNRPNLENPSNTVGSPISWWSAARSILVFCKEPFDVQW